MKGVLKKYILFAVVLLSSMAIASATELQDIPELKERVTDLTATLSTSQKASLEATLARFEASKGSQVVVLIVPSTKPEEIEQYSIRVADKWKVGRKDIDDGVILLIAKDDRKLRIEVGYGLEGAIPDAYAKRIIDNIIVPEFRSGDFAGGIVHGVSAIMSLIDGEVLPEVNQKRSRSGKNPYGHLKFLIFLIPVFIFIGTMITSKLGNKKGFAVNFALFFIILFILSRVLLISGVIALVFSLIGLNGRGGGGPGGGTYFVGGSSFGGGYSSGGFGGGGFGGGFGGGGGGFGGGGASGGW